MHTSLSPITTNDSATVFCNVTAQVPATPETLFHEYFLSWIQLFKEGSIRRVTLIKYYSTYRHVLRLAPTLRLKDINRVTYQQLLNAYAADHEHGSTLGFHHQIKGALRDAVDEGLISRDPTRKAILKGSVTRAKRPKFLNQFELHQLLDNLQLTAEVSWDWLILLIAKTGLRFSEALAITPNDFDFARQTLSVSKTWDYRHNTGFQPTKSRASVRTVRIDWHMAMQFQQLTCDLPPAKPIFINGMVCNATPNHCLERHCKQLGIPLISLHGLRHTHASLLMFAGVSVASVSRRLGHSSIMTTQRIYMHIIHELEHQDTDIVMRCLAGLS